MFIMKLIWIKDPKDGAESVSLTILVSSLLVLTVLGLAQVLGKINTLGPFAELFYSALALYFGRRLNISGKAFSSEQASAVQTTLTKEIQ